MDRQIPGPSKRLENAKNKLTPTRSAQFLRTEFRQRFLSRIKLSRSKNFDRLRQILEDVEEQAVYKSTEEFKTKLLDIPEANYLMSDSEVNSIMEEIEMELNVNDFETEACHYGKFSEMETADIVERHLNPCTMCERGNTDGAMCSPCRKSLYSQFKG